MMHENSITELPFDQYQRYGVVQEVVSLIRRRTARKLRILDVGGYAEGIGRPPFLPAPLFLPSEDVVVCDRRQYSDQRYLQADACALPFEDDRFDLVVSCDVLEHIRPENRVAALREMARVAKGYLLVAAPFYDTETDLAEKLFYDFHHQYLHQDLPNINEHRAYGLPDLSLLGELCSENRFPCVLFDSGYVPRWLLMAFFSYFSFAVMNSTEFYRRLQAFYNRNFFESDQRKPGYRKVAVIAKNGEQSVLEEVKARFTKMPPDSDFDYRPAELLLLLLQSERQRHMAEELQNCEDEQAGIWGEVLPDHPLWVRFNCVAGSLARIDLFLATYGRSNSCQLTFWLLEAETRKERARLQVPVSQILDSRWHPFRFPALPDSAGKTFEVFLESRDATPSNAITAYVTAEGGPCYRIYTLPTENERLAKLRLSEQLRRSEANTRELLSAILGAL